MAYTQCAGTPRQASRGRTLASSFASPTSDNSVSSNNHSTVSSFDNPVFVTAGETDVDNVSMSDLRPWHERRQRAMRKIAIVGGLVAIVLVVVLALGLHFGLKDNSEPKPSKGSLRRKEPERGTPTRRPPGGHDAGGAPEASPIRVTKMFQGQFQTVRGPYVQFKQAYRDKTSREYMALKEDFEKGMLTAFTNSPMSDVFDRCEVTGLADADVVIYFTLIFKEYISVVVSRKPIDLTFDIGDVISVVFGNLGGAAVTSPNIQIGDFFSDSFSVSISAGSTLVWDPSLLEKDEQLSVTKVFEADIRVTRGPYSTFYPDYRNPDSPRSQRLISDFTTTVNRRYKESSLTDFYSNCEVTFLRNGSVIIYFRLIFSDFISATAQSPSSPRKVKFDVNDITNVLIEDLPEPGGPPVDVTLGRFQSDTSHINVQPVGMVTWQSTTPGPQRPTNNAPPSTTSTMSSPSATMTPLSTSTAMLRTNSTGNCEEGRFQCRFGALTMQFMRTECIDMLEVCDGYMDCVAGTDEEGCGDHCANGGFRCRGPDAVDKYLRGKCTHAGEECDGYVDCTDRSDELGCACRPGEFRCENGTDRHFGDSCVPEDYVCDREDDCTDGSDERNCQYECDGGRFMCASGTVSRWPYTGYCIYDHERCDNYVDCSDASDEQDCANTCDLDEFRCANVTSGHLGHVCIPHDFLCDRDWDCDDGSDEGACLYTCPEGKYACATGTIARWPYIGFCLEEAERCNGFRDCFDGSDEANCQDLPCNGEQFRCVNGTDVGDLDFCISSSLQCDRFDDCSDGSDEAGCEYTCTDGLTACQNGTLRTLPGRPQGRGFCIHPNQLCDGLVHCEDGSDEDHCTDITCPEMYVRCENGTTSEGHSCIPLSQKCDLTVDCSDGSDEKESCTYSCQPSMAMCASSRISRWPFKGICIYDFEICDGMIDCLDRSDEARCLNISCGSGRFQCQELSALDLTDGVCIDDTYRCNHKVDCFDASDEKECSYPCPAEHYECTTGVLASNTSSCYPQRAICNGITDCQDGSDEFNCSNVCPVGFYSCAFSNLTADTTNQTRMCLPEHYVCDKHADCLSGSDEKGCDYVCQEGMFECTEGTVRLRDGRGFCLPEHWRCDGEEQCTDGSDERDCGELCDDDHFRCVNGTDVLTGERCVSSSYRCDRREDCSDGSDERNCVYFCRNNMIACETDIVARYPHRGFCIYAVERCDGYVDCVDASDEHNCSQSCINDDFRCSAGGRDWYDNDFCVESHFRCDRVDDCTDGSDETGCEYKCPLGMFACRTASLLIDPYRGYCLPAHMRCDGGRQCTDGSDEVNCTVCAQDEFECKTGMNPVNGRKCIPSIWVCDNLNDCSDGSDELNCDDECHEDQFRCVNGTIVHWPNGGSCIPAADRCNGFMDCSDQSDEANCPAVSCADNHFRCASGEDVFAGDGCIPKEHLCDRFQDCKDSSDEADCDYNCPDQQFQCENSSLALWPYRGLCLSQHRVCNGMSDCKDGSDEASCGSVCTDGAFRCQDGLPASQSDLSGPCLLPNQHCDGVPHCRDASDERGCNTSCSRTEDADDSSKDVADDERQACASGHKWYSNDRCLRRNQVCDSYVDCQDRSDEISCNLTCPADHFRCARTEVTWGATCLPATMVCDGVEQCYNGADEAACAASGGCAHVGFMPCASGDTCVPVSGRCDGRSDCPDSSDEGNC